MAEKISNLSKYATIEKTVVAKDGTTKFLLRMNDGNHVECVLLVQDYGNTVCISSQVGCKMNCVFCASGKCGWVRDLSMEEMLVQVQVANKHAGKNVSHVVIMGIGEPFDNFDNVIKFLNVVDVGARKISVSTCGLPDGIRRFADMGTQVNLCISLHAPNDEIRKQIMPIANKYPMEQLFDSIRYFFDKTKRRVIFEYALIDGVNCLPEHARELAKRLKSAHISYHVNLINLNPGGGSLKPPKKETALAFMDTLIKSGVSVTMRKGRGVDIMAACGQLKLQNDKRKKIELSISLDPALDGDWYSYVDEVNTWKDVTIHLDVKSEEFKDQYQYVLKNSKHQVDTHVFKNLDFMKELHNCGTVIDVDESIKGVAGDVFTVMTVKEGKSGQVFQASALEKVKKLRAKFPECRIIVDGGVNAENIASVRDAGADVIVVGSFIYKQPSPIGRVQMVSALLDILHK